MDVHVSARNTAKDLIVFFPEPPLELQPDLAGLVVADIIDRPLHRRRKISGDVGEHRQRDGADAIVALHLFLLSGLLGVYHPHPLRQLPDLAHLGPKLNVFAHLPLQGFGELVHPAHRLQHRHLLLQHVVADVVEGGADQAGVDDLQQLVGISQLTRGLTGAGRLPVASAGGAFVAPAQVQLPLRPQVLNQRFLVLFRHRQVQGILVYSLGQELARVAPHVVVDFPNPDWFVRQ